MKNERKITRRTILKALLTAYAFLSVCFTTMAIDHLLAKEYPDISHCVTLNDSWDITINDTLYPDVSLDDFHFDRVNKGDIITMTTPLPESLISSENALLLHTRQCAVNVYVDTDQIYQYGLDRIDRNKTVGSGYLTVELPDDYAGKTLKISLTVAEDQAFTRFDPLRIYEWENIYRVLLTETRLPLFLGCFLTVFGLVVCCITIFALLFSGKFLRILCISIFSICIGLWTLCYYNVLLIFSMPLYTICLLEYMSLYLAPIPMVIYMREDVRALEQPVMYTIYKVLLAIQIIVTTGAIFLHSIDVVHCAALLKYMQALIVCHLVYSIIVEFMNLRRSHQLVHRLFLLGILMLFACVSYDLIYYNLERYRGMNSLPTKGIASLGLVLFIFILIVSFYVNLTQKMMQETERNFLIKSAYTDELTQIHNRRYCMEYMNRIQETERLNYTVFCFDLNNLKVTNDTYGHAKGDILIRSAAEVITETFEADGMVARMGGDEFIAIVEVADARKLTALTETFQACIDRKNREIPDLNMSIAFGYACNTAEINTVEKVYQTADDRMYQHKQHMKRSSART
ncbi:MAG: GGDEF domain-containing protein [Lachnospiraceae bacterium]|nr:GGDEF domain-containing protein [Lachnospiraceae bacterium]